MIMSSTVVNVGKMGGFVFKMQSLWYFLKPLRPHCFDTGTGKSPILTTFSLSLKVVRISDNNGLLFVKSHYSSSTFICSDTFGRCCILQMLQHFVWFRREETEKTALFVFEAMLCKLFHEPLHCLYPLPHAIGVAGVCWSLSQLSMGVVISLSEGHMEFSIWPHMHVFGLCDDHANSTQKGPRGGYWPCELLASHYATFCSEKLCNTQKC